MVGHNMTAEGLHDVHCSSALPTYVLSAMLLHTMRNMHIVVSPCFSFCNKGELLRGTG